MKEIIAKEGMWLTQATTIEEENRIFVKKICGYNVNEAYWRDATNEEKDKWDEEHKIEDNEIR